MSGIITVENLGKKYRLRHQKQETYATLRDTITNSVKNIFSSNKENKATIEEFWALRNVSFEIQKGDRVGIIGSNGAGKSTLLKILSRVVHPTEGRITMEGKIASLLEVGTGFHPELSGRENIYLNGVILGMSRKEIQKKFDEIVAFSEIDKFLDTPVKRYSSGMFVRLAFSVAVHMEPDILIVDEVLAVGDAQFQKKSAAKMESISKDEGRTILFVSHNMPAMAKLCPTSIYLKDGMVKRIGNTEEVVHEYLVATNAL
jgi:lipopolysaccharide transport system ATP-binding protein